MTSSSFTGLCEILVRDGGLRPTVQITVEEQVAKTLYLLAHNVTNCELSFMFRRSGESDCIGTIDGTHIRVQVSQHEAPKYRGRKDYPTQNVLVACTFNLKFTYVLAWWKDTASDSRIMKEALNSQDALKIPEERAFGVLKQRFPIISKPNDKLLAQVDAELMNDDNTMHEEPPNSRETNKEFRKAELIRDGIAAAMWANYQD
ncbi:hypothetical protein P3S68_020959 [Capsicum galapagoense]